MSGNTCCCKCRGCSETKAPLEGIVKGKPEITYNTNRFFPNGAKAPDGIEIRFGLMRPTVEVREMLKAHGYKFSEKQRIWYAKDNTKSKELATFLESNEVDLDDTLYEKKNFWAKVASIGFYKKLSNYTEFMIKGQSPQFFRTKKQLENKVSNPISLIMSDSLRFKKFYNKVVGEDGEEGETEEEIETEEGDGEHEAEENETEQDDDDSIRNIHLADKLKDLGERMQKDINSKMNSAISQQNPTLRRMRIAAGMRNDGRRLHHIQSVLFALSETYRRGNIFNYPFLKNIRTKTQIELLNRYADVYGNKEEDHYLQSTFNHHKAEFKQLGINSVSDWSLAISQKGEMLEHFPSEQNNQFSQEEEKIKELEREIKGMKISGFFPTPKDVIAMLIALADLKGSDSILEPSAGKGDILDAISDHFGDYAPELSAYEINSKLRELLTLKGYKVVGTDFLQSDNKRYDKIIMNPPFENGLDIDHVSHAFSLLNPGGRVVAIMSEGVFFRKFKKDEAFRELLSEKNAYVSEPIKNAFKNSFNSTGVSIRIVAINEDGSYPELTEEAEQETDYQTQNETENMDELDLLEIEAQAEIELLKLQVELARKRKGLNGLKGLDGINKNKLKLLKLKAMAFELAQFKDFK